jgi:hypothetical protein
MHGFNNLGHYLQSGNQVHLKVFLNQVDWLEAHAVIRGDGAVVWPHDFDHQESAVRLKAPWLSANAQGLVIVRWFAAGESHVGLASSSY